MIRTGRTASPLLGLFICAALLAACAASRANLMSGDHPAQESSVVALAVAMSTIARGEADISVALAPFATMPSPADVPKSGVLRFRGFRDAAGYVLRELEVRVWKEGVDGASLVLAHFAPEPCIHLEPLATQLGATEFFGIPPSPHAPAGTPGVRGYTAHYPDRGSLSVWASTEAPNCIIGISSRPAGSHGSRSGAPATHPVQEALSMQNHPVRPLTGAAPSACFAVT